MPSEAQSQEPRDRGPHPPVTRAGRSAQLAKAAATSPTPERRFRGRLRRDGGAPPPPPPPPKPRKKGRSRGRAQVEDEEGMNATENPSEKIEVKEKLTGWRRSTPRRKSNTNPEPDPEQTQDPLSPDPDLVPTAPEPSPEPAPMVEEMDREQDHPALSADPPPTVDPQSPAPSPDPDPDLDPDPGEEGEEVDQPTPMAVDFTVPLEMEEVSGVNPMETTSALTPYSSPRASPCPRLEDEDSLSPLFQRSLSEESGSSPTPSLGHTKKRLKQCAFCYHGDDPHLGQGHLVVFGPTPGYIPLHILNRRASSDRDNDCHDHCYRGDQAPPICSSPEQSEAESSSEFVAQLGPIGLPCDIDVQSLFDPTGQCCAHLQCAAWSEGVCRGEGQSLLYVDKAIDSGSTQVCAFCRRLGASLRCQEMGCGRSYHFPCAAAAGAHQDWNERHTMCTRHTLTVSSQCVSCSGGPEGGSLLMCCCCGSHFHGSCLDPPVALSPLCRAGWQCPQCRVCQNCRLQGDDSALLVCERCDKVYHTKCLSPPVEDTPTRGWHCRNCRICRCCDVRASGRWANHPFLCESCDPALPCSLCGHTPDLYSPQDYLTCTCCFRCVHKDCTVQTGEGRTLSEGFMCSACRPQEEELSSNTPVPHDLSITESHNPSKALLVCLSQPSGLGHTEDPPISPTANTPVQFTCSELPQSPPKSISTTLHHSPSPSQTYSIDLHHSPFPSHLDLKEEQQSLATSHQDSTERQESLPSSYPEEPPLSSASSHPDLVERQESPAPSHPDSTEPQESVAPPHPESAEPPLSLAPSYLDATEWQENLIPSYPDPAEPAQSPTPSHSDPTQGKESLALSHPDPAEPSQSPAPSLLNPTERQESPAPSQPDPLEQEESPAPSHLDPPDQEKSPAPSHLDSPEREESPAPSHPDPPEGEKSPAPSHPDPLVGEKSLAPSHLDSPEREESPAPSHPDPPERQETPAPSHPDHAEPPPHSPVPPHLDPLEQQCFSLSHSNLAELQQNPVLSHSDPAKLKQSFSPDPTRQEQTPVPSYSDSSEFHQRPHPDPIEPKQISEPSDPAELRSSPAPSQHIMEQQPSPALHHNDVAETHQSPVPSPADISDLQKGSAPSHPDPAEVHQSTAPSPAEFQPGPAPPYTEFTENLQSPAPSRLEPSENLQRPALPFPAPTEQILGPSHPESVEKLQSLALSHSGVKSFHEVLRPSVLGSKETIHSPSHLDLAQCKQSTVPSHSSQTELQESFNLDPSEPKSHTASYHGPVDHQENNTQSPIAERELQQSLTPSTPTKLSKSQAHEIPMQDQHNPPIAEQLSPIQSDHSTILALNSAKDQMSPVQGSPGSHSCGHSPHSPPPITEAQVMLHRPPIHSNPTQFSPLYHSPAQDNSPQLHQSPSSLHHAAQSPPSPAQGPTLLQSSTQDGESKVDQESPESSCPDQQDISTLDQDLPTLSYRVTQIPCSHVPQISISAPCSPSPHPVRPVQCGQSEPASPAQADSLEHVRPLWRSKPPFQKNAKENTQSNSTEAMGFLMQMCPDPEGQTPESSSTSDLSTMPLSSITINSQLPNQLDLVQSSTGSLNCPSPIHKTATPTPESLVHISTSADHSSRTLSPCADIMEEDPPLVSPLHENASNGSPSYYGDVSPKCNIASSGSASPLHVNEKYDSQLTSSAPVETGPTYSLILHHDKVVDHLRPQTNTNDLQPIPVGPITHSSPVHIETNNDCGPVDPVMESSIICSPPEQTQILTGTSPKYFHQSNPLHKQTICSPAQMSSLQSPASCSPPHCKATDISPTSNCVSHSLNCSTSDLHSPPRSSPAGHTSPTCIQTTSSCSVSGAIQRPCLSDSPAQASVGYVSPAQASPDPAPGTITIGGRTNVSPLMKTVASSIIQTTVLPIAAQVHSGPDKPVERADQMSSMSATSFPVNLTSFNPNQPSQCPDRPASPHPVSDRSAEEVYQSTDAISLIHQKTTIPDQASTQASPMQTSPTWASPIYVSSIHTSPTQDNTAIPSTSHNSEIPLSSVSPLPLQACSVPKNSIGSAVCTPLKMLHSSHIGPVQPEKISSSDPSTCLRLKASAGPVCLLHCGTSSVHESAGQETRSSDVPPGPTSGPKSCQEISETQMEYAASVGMVVAEESEEMKKNPEEGMEDLKSEEKPDKRMEQREVEDQEDMSSSWCLPSEVQLTSDLPEDHQSPLPHASLLSTPYSALVPPLLTPGAGFKEASPCSSPSCQGQNQSQSLFEHTKDKHQSQDEPSERGDEPVQDKEGKGAEQEDQSDVEEEEEEEEPVSPVLDLDHSLDMEVMELMATHLSPPNRPPLPRQGKGLSLRPPPCSSRPLDDLSIRLRQSPFSTEASPETSPHRVPITPPPLSPLTPLRASPVVRESPPFKPQPAPTTVIPLTPKIGMGKPAITKRKFSPGRARVKQASWWSHRRAISPLLSSQDSTGEGGWDSPKPRPLDSPLWSMKVSRSSCFPGRRRSRGGGVGGGRGGRGRSRLKTHDSLAVSPVMGGFVESFQMKEDEENSMHNTVVMFSTSDHFTLKQDMCVVCGSFGQGAEGRLLACSQCGQCYHPYCVNVKITRVVLTKGWRCLECTVCEACGEASDPGRLLLCDDCDISYHTYCLKPPLLTVPKGAWKCKWCVWCVQCGATSPGLQCEWQNNYSRCGPCSSLSRCPLCQRQYSQDDLILQCQQCDRWVHAVCQGLTTEDEVEIAADDGFNCSLCKTHGRSSYGRLDSFDSPYMAQIISRTREPDTKTYTQDGVCLTESGLSHLQSLVEPLTSPRRYRRCKPKLKLRIINQNSVSVLQTPETEPSTEQEHRGDLECDLKSDSSPERDHVHDDDLTKEPEVADVNKKRKRKPYRPGIGGFMVRQRGGKAGGPSRIKLCQKDSTEMLPGQDEGLLDADVSMETAPSADQTMEKAKKRYRKKKTKLEETFPSYLQEAFFGRNLLDQSRQMDQRPGPEAPGVSQPQAATGEMKVPAATLHHGPAPQKHRALPMSEEALVDLSDVLNTDPHILATGHTGQFQVERSPSPFAGLDISSMGDPSTTTAMRTGSGGHGQRAAQEEPLDAILSPELDKMVSDGAILSKLYKIPELEGKDVEEVFTAVLSPNSSNTQSEQSQHTATGSKTNTQYTAGGFPRLPLMNGLMGPSYHFPNVPMLPSGAQSASRFRMPPPTGPTLAPPPLLPPRPTSGPAAANQALAEGEQDVMSTAQRSTLKWEKEEMLGELATVAPVLYCNTNFPQLKEQYPDWSTRVKQIAKLWRKASSQDRAPFVQKARDNRAAQRISKVQLSNDPLKRHPHTQLPPGPYDPLSMETEVPFKDPLRPKESEQEQEWKFRQQMRQKSKQLAKIEATQKLEQVKIEQLRQQQQQQLMVCQRLTTDAISPETGSHSPMTPTQQPFAGGNASPLQPRLLPQGAHGSGSDDVFLRPQAPPPSGYSSLPLSPHPSSPLHQPPSSPQMFSPPSSRPSSPWDPYSKVVGTPRPPSSQSQTPQHQQRRNSISASPAHDAVGSPAPSPDSKASDISRSLGPPTGLQQIRPGMLSPPSGSGPDLSARLVGLRASEPCQRTPINNSAGRSGDPVQGGVFKAPMPPQLQQEAFTGGRRDMSRPTDPGLDVSFPSSPLSGLGSPHRSPYAQTPGTPRPDYSQQMSDPFSHQSPLTSRPSPEPYANPQTPGTPCPHSDPAYLPTPPALRLDQFNQQSANQRPSPSHPNVDPYSSNPGTPRSAATDRFPRSPGTQAMGTLRPSPDPYTQQPSTPRPQKAPEPFSQTPVEGFTTQLTQSSSSPRAPGLTGDMVTFTTPHQLHQSPGQQHQDLFPRTLSCQTPKHTGMSEDSGFTDLFEQNRIIAGPQTDKMTTNDMSVLGVTSLDVPISMLPQLGDSEEKLRQRQRLRQLILRQQQQKSALRQEKGLQEVASGSGPIPPAAAGPASAMPRQWSQDDSSSASDPPADLFGRPPPPYPGTVRPGAPSGAPRFPPGFPGDQQRSFALTDSAFPRQKVPRELGVRGPALRFAVPPLAPTGLQNSFLRLPQCSVSGSSLTSAESVPVQIRRSMPTEFTGIRPLSGPSTHPHMMPGVPQPFLPRSLPIQQHSIMGQPYIELRHRVPENRLRLPFSLPTTPDTEVPLLHSRDPHPPAGQAGPDHQQMAIEQLNPPQDQQHLGHATAALAQTAEHALPGADGIEEHLEGEDSAVKDLEDVEVKDLVDLNLNLDPEDGKEDLDLGPNDLHLDDFLLSGKFDLIAYADPELNLEDKKDMFNEELDLGETVDDKDGTERRDSGRKTDSHVLPASQIKQEAKDGVKIEGKVGSSRPIGAEAGGSATSSKNKVEDCSVPGALPGLQDQGLSSGLPPRVLPPIAPAVQQPVFQQRAFGPPSNLVPPHPQALPVSPHPSLTSQGPAAPPHLLLNPHTQTPHLGITSAQVQVPNQNQAVFLQDKSRPLLLEEQPLLLQDLLDQERQEQQQQKQMQALIRQRSTSEPVLPNMDFDSISDPIMKAKMVALKGINKVMTQGNLGLNPMVINRFQQDPGVPAGPVPEATPPMVGQDGKLKAQMVRPTPPSFGSGFINESQRRQYEEWLGETQQLLQMQQRLLEDQITAHRKTKKALSAKQRTAKKAGRPFPEDDAAQLRFITEQQGVVQKQLEQIRKQQKDHTELIEDYRTKQQQQQRPPAPPIMPSRPPLLPQTMLTQPIVPTPHSGGLALPRVPSVCPGWTPGGGTPGVMGQRMSGHLPAQTPPAQPNTPQVPTHTQTGPSAGFTPGPRGPNGGSNGAAGDGAAPTPQVKFDDNNPFSEGFQERERRERLREQQERQRVQLMHEVERHRALQQRLELEQQGLLGAPMGPGARVAPPSGSGVTAGLNLSTSVGESLSQMPFFSSELPQDFLQSPPASRPPPQGQQGAPFPSQGGSRQGFSGGPHLTPVNMPSSNLQTRPKLLGPGGLSVQGQGCSAGMSATGLTPSHPPGHRFGPDSASSSPSTPLPSAFPGGSGGPASLIQLYSDIIPDDKPKKKRSRKKDGDDTGGEPRTPLSSHSDDVTAPPTPSISDTACSTPTRGSLDQSDLSFPQISALSGLAPSSELERQLSISTAAQESTSILGMESQSAPLYTARLEVKEERVEGRVCGESVVKMEEGEDFSSPSDGGDGGKELLRHLLKDKTSPVTTPSPTRQAPSTGLAPPAAHRQLSMESTRSEDEDGPSFHCNVVGVDSPGPDAFDPSIRKKPQRCKRQARPDKERAPPKYKRRKREEEEKMLQSSTNAASSSSDPLMTHLRQLSVLPLMEPVLGVDLSLFPPYGSSCLGRDSRLSGSFGNGCLDGVTDYYSQLIYKQNNLSNPPTPPASLPPTPPPVARQNLVNGFATTEELARKDITEQEVKSVSGLKHKREELLALNHTSRTVDVPASLPTPPHNNQEELRVQDMSDRDSLDGFIPSSSPESVADVEVSRYPDLSFIKLEPPSPCPSPPIPILPCAKGKGSAVKQEVKTEPNHQGPPSCSNTDLVTIAITVNPVAAQNVPGVMAAVAQLLRLPVPLDYHLNRPSCPERSSLALLAGVRVPLMQASTGNRTVRPPANNSNAIRLAYGQPAAARPDCCSQCNVQLGNGVRIVKELKQEGQPRPGPSLVFCSPTCSAQHTSDLQNSAHKVGPIPIQPVPSSKTQHQYTNNMSSIAVHTLPHNPPSAGPIPSPPLSFPPASAISMETKPRMDSLKVKVKLKPRPRAVPGGDDPVASRHGKRMKSSRWRRWNISIALHRGPCIPTEAVAMPTEEELTNLGVCLRPDLLPKDQRRCCFCHQQGDGLTDGPARLLNLDLDLWVHLNCALWSSEVYETQAGALINVELALRRGLTLRCAHCQQTGATSGCNRLRCTNTYHFTCALQAHCTFFKDKTMLCQLHKPRTGPVSGDRSSSASPSSTPGLTPDPAVALTSDPYDSELRCFSVFRRVYVQRDEARQIAAVVQRGERQHTFRVGSLLFRAVGRLLPHQLHTFHSKTAIFPVGYHANRIYWSMRHGSRRCKYMCYIEDKDGEPLFKVRVVEKGHEDLILTGPTPKAVWDQILDPVSQIRSASGTLKLFPVYLKGEDLFGLTSSAVTRIIESLPGVEACERYTFRYGRNPLMEWPLAFNPSGSARSEPKASQAKRPNLLTSIAPRCQGSVGSIVGLIPGVISLSPGETVAGAHQGRHSKSSQYRRMKAEWKTNVYLARSGIQGLGLYAARDIEKCTMVIEYIGTIIRSEVANRKERLYESQNRGVYMFRIDNDYVIDATITGGPARYINHSCAPNCITEVVTVEKENKIIISSCRRIQRGEELCYDYKFDLEDDQHKIPCHCGAVNCRKWMN